MEMDWPARELLTGLVYRLKAMGVKLSIIVPVYGVAKYLPKCVDSLLAQDISNYEIVLVDDGSPDECPQICDEYSTKYSNIKVVHQVNAGLSAARNTGVSIAEGDYILFVDSDDYLQPNTLGTLLEQAEGDDLDVLRFRYQNVRESGEVFVPHEGMKTDYNDYSAIPTDGLTFLNERMWVQCYVVQFLVRREIVLQEQFTPGIYFEDTDWTPRMLLRTKRVASTDLVVYNYLWREGSITLSQKDINKMRKQLDDKLALIGKLNMLGNRVANRRWFDGMISGLVINVVGIIAQHFYSERKDYIKQLKSFGVLPIKNINVAPRAVRKLKLVNLSIALAVWVLHCRS